MASSPRYAVEYRWLTPLLLAYAALAVYGSLYPFSGWVPPQRGLWTALASSLAGHHSRADMVVNLLVYMPLGLLLALRAQARLRPLASMAAAAAAGFAVSLAMECIQLYLPARTTSVVDLLLNTLGTMFGAALPLVLSDRYSIGRRLHRFREHWVESGPVASLRLLVVAVWAMSHLTPFVPSLDIGTLREGLSPLYHTLRDPYRFDAGKALSYSLALLAVALLAVSLLRPGRPHRWLAAGALLAAVLLAKVPIIARSLSAEAVTGAAFAIAGVRLLERIDARQLLAIVALCLVGAHAAEQLRPAAGMVSGDMHWRLFSMQMLNVHGLQDILADIWPFLGFAYVAARAGLPGTARVIGGGAVAVGLLAAMLEWTQSAIPGRHADVTDVVLAIAGWTLPWLNPVLRNNQKPALSR